MNEKLLEEMIKDVLSSMMNNEDKSKKKPTQSSVGNKLTTEDYPIQEKHPELIKTPTDKSLEEITMEEVVNGSIDSKDIRVAPEVLELQAQVAESAGRKPFAGNLRRAAELTSIPDERILEVYNALRPNRSTKEELLAIADELENQFNAKINADFVREAADVYADRDILRVD